MTHFEMSFGEWLRQRRKSLDLTQKALARQAGYSEIAIRKFEADEYRPSREGAESLAVSLGVPPEQRQEFLRFARGEAHAAPPPVDWGPNINDKPRPADDRAGSPLRIPHAAPRTQLVGRKQELVELQELIFQRGARLITLGGPPGIGKTRLGVQVIYELAAHFRDGVLMLPLDSLRDPELVAPSLARALKLRVDRNGSADQIVVEWLRGRQVLLLLDNFEQIMPARAFLSGLVAECPMLTLLVTSRESLHLQDEQYFPVQPLALPDPAHLPPLDELKRLSAIELFVSHAQLAQPGFDITAENAETVAAICAYLDGLPLAIELVAARTRLLSPKAIMSRLEQSRLKLLAGGPSDPTGRHESLRDAIQWSYELLDPNEKILFARMSVFSGGCTLSAVEAVCNARNDLNVGVVDGLSSLLDKSLLYGMRNVELGVRNKSDESAPHSTFHIPYSEEPRLAMLETIREFAWECLVVSGEAGLMRGLHTEYYLALAEAAEPQLVGSEQKMWLLQLERDLSNVRAALSWAVERPDLETAERLAGALWRFWDVRGYLSEGREWLRRILLLLGDATNDKIRAGLSNIAGRLALLQGDYTEAASFYEQSLAMYRVLADKRGVATSVAGLANVLSFRGDDGMARVLYEESLAIFKELDEKWNIANTENSLGLVIQRQGDYPKARELFESSLQLRREAGDKRGVAFTLHNLARLMQYQGDFEQGRELYAESLDLLRELEDRRGTASSLNNLGDLLRLEGDYSGAEQLITESIALYRQLEDRRGIAVALIDFGSLTRDRGEYPRARDIYCEVLPLIGQVGGKYDIARTLVGVACLVVGTYPERAVQLFAVAASLQEASGTTLSPVHQHEHDHYLAAAKARLSREVATRAWEEGLTMDPDAAVDYAQRTLDLVA